MATNYHIRTVCDEVSPFEYYRTIQVDTLDETVECSDHPGKATRDFVIEEITVS